jgi:hypothetical protein
MNDKALNDGSGAPEPEAQVTPQDAAAYIFQISGELAAMADDHGFSRLAAALELARSQAAEALAVITTSRQPKAAPDDAA